MCMKKDKEIFNKLRISFTAKILEILQSTASTSLMLFDAMSSSKPESYRKLKTMRPDQYISGDWAENYKEKQKLFCTLSRLKRDGFIENKDDLYKITKNGLLKLFKEKPRQLKIKILEQSEHSDKIIVFSYDIPERDRRERLWVIEILKLLDFEMVHQSTWIGKNKLPQEFLKELIHKGILDYVRIFEINKKGNLIEI